MSSKLLAAVLFSLLLVGGCAQQGSPAFTAPEQGDANYLKATGSRADELYITSTPPAGGRDYRDVYIAPVNVAHLHVVSAVDGPADADWAVTADEKANLQAIVRHEMSLALGHHSAFNVVDSAEEAEIILSVRLLAIHPNATRAQVAAGAKLGGSVTASLALRDAASGEVLVRSVDTRSTDDIWAFNQVDNEEPAISLLFRAWGNSVRRGILALQGRTSDPLAPVIQAREQ